MFENPNIVAAGIAFAGAIASVLGSLLVTFLSTRFEIRKIRTALQNQYSSSILEKRLNAYGGCYYILSHFIKRARGFVKTETLLTYADIQDFNDHLNEWDSKHALLMSPRAILLMYALRKGLKAFLDRSPAEGTSVVQDYDNLENLIKRVMRLERALRNDVAIYEVEKYEGKRFFSSDKEFTKDITADINEP